MDENKKQQFKNIKEFVDQNYQHFNAASLKDAAKKAVELAS